MKKISCSIHTFILLSIHFKRSAMKNDLDMGVDHLLIISLRKMNKPKKAIIFFLDF